MCKKRNVNLDALKGVAVIAVLLGHSIQRGLIKNYTDVIIFKIIYTFHMPLFIILSGYALFKYTKKVNFNIFVKKFNRLIIPTFIWSFIVYFMRNLNFVGIKPFIYFPDSIVEYIKTIIIYPTYVIWFLYTIFFCSLFLLIQRNFFQRKSILLNILMTFTIMLLLFQIKTDKFGIPLIKNYFPLFCVGYYAAPYDNLIKKHLKYMFLPALIIYILLFKYFEYGYTSNIINYIIAISSTIILWFIITIIKNNKLKNVMANIGEKSLEIYLCQCICLNIGIGSGKIRVISIFITASIISYALAYVTVKNRYLKMLLYGAFNIGGKNEKKEN